MLRKEILEKLNTKEFVKSIITKETKEEVIKAFAQEGLEITNQEADELGLVILNTVSKISEMTPDELEKVSGGLDLREAFDYIPSQIERELGRHRGGGHPDYKSYQLLSWNSTQNVGVLIKIAQGAILWEGGKWIVRRAAQSSWWTKLKGKVSG